MSDEETVYGPDDDSESTRVSEGEGDAVAAGDGVKVTRVMGVMAARDTGMSGAADASESGASAGEQPEGERTRLLDPQERRRIAAPETASDAPQGGDPTGYQKDARSGEVCAEVAHRQLLPGTVLFGEYEIVDVLGAGGMGEVYRARHRRLDETRAIKVMHANMAREPTAAEFFDREAKALLSVRHEAVVHCHDLLSDDEGRVYLVMEMVDGISLADRILTGGALAEEEVRTLAGRLGAGLAAAHRRGVIHRDLSPDNVILPGGRPEEAKLIDFGIAKVLAAGQETILEGFKGKLAYASPEQLGFFDGRIDGRSDIYSLGLVLYAAATGRALPMGGSVVEAVDARRQLAGIPDDCPPSLRADIERCLSLHPDDRPETIGSWFGEDGGPAIAWRLGGRRTLIGASAITLAALLALVGIALRPAPPLDAEPVALRPLRAEAAPAPESPKVAVAVEPESPADRPAARPAAPRRDRTGDAVTRLRLMGLLRGAESALERNALMSPPGENAYEKYRAALSIDPKNREAREGIRTVADRYLALARDAMERGELDEAEGYLSKARIAAPRHPDLAAATASLRKRRAGG